MTSVTVMLVLVMMMTGGDAVPIENIAGSRNKIQPNISNEIGFEISEVLNKPELSSSEPAIVGASESGNGGTTTILSNFDNDFSHGDQIVSTDSDNDTHETTAQIIWEADNLTDILSAQPQTHVSALRETHVSAQPQTHVSALRETRVSAQPQTHVSALRETHVSAQPQTHVSVQPETHVSTQPEITEEVGQRKFNTIEEYLKIAFAKRDVDGLRSSTMGIDGQFSEEGGPIRIDLQLVKAPVYHNRPASFVPYSEPCDQPCQMFDMVGICRVDEACVQRQNGHGIRVGASIIGSKACPDCYRTDMSGRCRLMLTCYFGGR